MGFVKTCVVALGLPIAALATEAGATAMAPGTRDAAITESRAWVPYPARGAENRGGMHAAFSSTLSGRDWSLFATDGSFERAKRMIEAGLPGFFLAQVRQATEDDEDVAAPGGVLLVLAGFGALALRRRYRKL